MAARGSSELLNGADFAFRAACSSCSVSPRSTPVHRPPTILTTCRSMAGEEKKWRHFWPWNHRCTCVGSSSPCASHGPMFMTVSTALFVLVAARQGRQEGPSWLCRTGALGVLDVGRGRAGQGQGQGRGRGRGRGRGGPLPLPLPLAGGRAGCRFRQQHKRHQSWMETLMLCFQLFQAWEVACCQGGPW